jgi:hypothetical protein
MKVLSEEPAKRAAAVLAEQHVYRPFHGLWNNFYTDTQGSAALHPGLYAFARWRGLVVKDDRTQY